MDLAGLRLGAQTCQVTLAGVPAEKDLSPGSGQVLRPVACDEAHLNGVLIVTEMYLSRMFRNCP